VHPDRAGAVPDEERTITLEPVAFSQSPVGPGIGEGALEARPPGAARVETMLETVGIAIFLVLLVGAAAILIRRKRRR
jgi:hypothetical protein